MASMLNKLTRFAQSPEGRRTISGFTNRGTGGTRGTSGRGMRSTGRGVPSSGGTGGMLGKLASGFLSGRRR
jgi:hypothetical protein